MASIAEDDEPFGLLPAKRVKAIDWTKCLVCQGDKPGETLRKASPSGLDSFSVTSKIRKDEVYERITLIWIHSPPRKFSGMVVATRPVLVKEI